MLKEGSILLFFSIINISTAILTLYSNDTDFAPVIAESGNNNFDSVYWGIGRKESIDYARLVVADPLGGCELLNTEEVRGRYFL